MNAYTDVKKYLVTGDIPGAKKCLKENIGELNEEEAHRLIMELQGIGHEMAKALNMMQDYLANVRMQLPDDVVARLDKLVPLDRAHIDKLIGDWEEGDLEEYYGG